MKTKSALLLTIKCSIVLLLFLVSVEAVPVRAGLYWVAEEANAADAPGGIDAGDAQAVAPDRISFYNVPADAKLESHIDYADGREEKIKYPAALCAQGTVITQPLNLYAAAFVAEGCGETVFQHLNLRWLGGCWFDFEHDPDAHIVARGPYGEQVIGDGHYPAGELQLNNIPANTTSLSATMRHTDEQGNVLTGNVAFSFHQPHLGCSQAPTPTPTATQPATATIAIATPTATSTETSTATATTTATATGTQTPTVTNTTTPTATELPPGGSSTTDTPTPTATSTEMPTIIPTATRPTAVLPPTGLDPIDEPGAAATSTVYLPLVVQ